MPMQRTPDSHPPHGLPQRLTLLASLVLAAAHAADPVPQLRAVATGSPPAVSLSWSGSGTHTIYRTTGIGLPQGGGSTSSSWGSPIATVSGSSWVDSTVVAGGPGYEYRVVSSSTGNIGYVFAGVAKPVVDGRGAVVLVIEDSLIDPLACELDRLQVDLIGDGYRVLRLPVSRSDTPAQVRSRLQALRSANGDLGTAFLLGRIPVARSGWMNPDGHFSRSMPADAFYGDLDGTWTDTSVNADATSGNLSIHRNVPGDGSYDQTYLPSDVDLEIGRVDFAEMNAFLPLTEVDLMRRYLDRDHAWRTGALSIEHRLANKNGRPEQCHGQLFGTGSMLQLPGSGNPNPDYWSTFEADSYLLFMKGGGGGTYNSTTSVGSTLDYARSPGIQVMINAQSASYYCEWDVKDAFLRAPLAAKGYGLISFYYELPTWILHHLGSGGTIGQTARISQNNNGYYNQSFQVWGMGNTRRVAYISLQGDPTLRIHVVKPPSAVRSTPEGQVTWTASAEAGIAGYHVYRAASADGTFQRITAAPVTGTSFTDPAPPGGSKRYQVRAVKLESRGGSGSYWNSSTGILDDQGPRVVQAMPSARNAVLVSFDRPVTAASAQAPGNYSISGGVSVTAAAIQADQRSVLLTTSAQAAGASYTLTADGIAATGSPSIAGASSLGYAYQEKPEFANDAATVALYHLDGDGLDSSGNGRHLTLGSNLAFSNTSPVGAAHRALWIRASGTDAANLATATIPDSAFQAAGNAVTFEAHAYFEGFNTAGIVNAKQLSLAQEVWNGVTMRLATEGMWDIKGSEYERPMIQATGVTALSNLDFRKRIPLQRWLHLAMEYDGASSCYVYADGQLLAGPIAVTNYASTTSNWSLIIGNFIGKIDEVRISSLRRSQAAPVPPAMPGGVVATAGNGSVAIAWNAVSGAASYRLQRSLSASGPFTTVASGLTSTAYNDTGLSNGTTYHYVVAAVNSAGTGANSAPVSATPSQPVALPGAPTGLVATPGDAQVALAWSAVSGANTYTVRRGQAASGPFTTVASGLAATSWLDAAAANGTTWYYVVAAVNAAGTGANSAVVSATPQAAVGSGGEFASDAATIALYHFNGSYADAGPRGLNLSASAGVSLSADNTGWMSTPAGQVVRFSGANATLTAALPDAAVLPGPSLGELTLEARIFVRNYVAYGNANLPIISVQQAWDAGIQVVDGKWNSPRAPTVGAGTNGTIVSAATWDASVSRNAWHALRITQSSAGLVTVAIDGQVIGSAGITQNIGRTGDWLLTLGNFDGDLDEVRISSVVRSDGGTAPVLPPAPTGLVATAGDASVELAWSAVASATSYIIERGTSAQGPFQSIADPVQATSYADAGLVNGTTYHYRVLARNSAGAGAASAVAEATPTAPVAGGDEFVPDASTIALYHFNGGFADAGANGLDLTATGGVTLASDNLGWMAQPAGSVVRFAGLNARLDVAIPDALVLPGTALAPITIDARIFVRNYRAYSVDNFQILGLTQAWDTGIMVQDGKWNDPKAPVVNAGGTTSLVSPSTWDAVVTRNAWHALRIAQDANGVVTVYIDGVPIGSATVQQNAGRSNDWTLTLGNFDGDIDELRIVRAALGGPAG